ncbi:hypothetical protein BaRGS_00031715 [Batillaria attramentaria]|uniref:Uncharacterized protein n=1 Tax=Batillaria attramentaria TaxID=370345 RepID=A0ABD0JPT2_9CAEN
MMNDVCWVGVGHWMAHDNVSDGCWSAGWHIMMNDVCWVGVGHWLAHDNVSDGCWSAGWHIMMCVGWVRVTGWHMIMCRMGAGRLAGT